MDRYSKIVLSAICLSLLWLCVRGLAPAATKSQKGGGVVDVVRAKRFLVVDSQGNVRASLGLKHVTEGRAGIPSLELNSVDGKNFISLFLYSGACGGSLMFGTAKPFTHIMLGTGADGPCLSLGTVDKGLDLGAHWPSGTWSLTRETKDKTDRWPH